MIKMEFKVGDRIRGINDDYWYTNKDMYLGEVIAVEEHGIDIKILKHKDSTKVGREYIAEYPNGKFEIVELTKSELQSKIDKLENINKKLYSTTISNRDKIAFLKREIMNLKEENKPILDNAEKRYLENVIRPFKDKVTSIAKLNYWDDEYINIDMHNEAIVLPNFKKNTMYKDMKKGEKYTLKELGLFEENK